MASTSSGRAFGGGDGQRPYKGKMSENYAKGRYTRGDDCLSLHEKGEGLATAAEGKAGSKGKDGKGRGGKDKEAKDKKGEDKGGKGKDGKGGEAKQTKIEKGTQNKIELGKEGRGKGGKGKDGTGGKGKQTKSEKDIENPIDTRRNDARRCKVKMIDRKGLRLEPVGFVPHFLVEEWPLQPRVGDFLDTPAMGPPRLTEAGKMTPDEVEKFAVNFGERMSERRAALACSEMLENYYQYMVVACRTPFDNSDARALRALFNVLKDIADLAPTAQSAEDRVLSDAVRSMFVRKLLPTYVVAKLIGTADCADFALAVVKAAPQRLCFVKPLLFESCAGGRSERDFERLWQIVEAASDGLAISGGHYEAASWRAMPVVPQPLSADLRDISDLPVARTQYDSTEEYLDTMFRLLRANCFLKLQRGICDFLKGTLDFRDMMMYNVSFDGIALLERSAGFVISASCKAYQGKLKSRSLMFGNLLCISVGERAFESVLWGKVVERPKCKVNARVTIHLQFPDELNRAQGFDLLLALLKNVGRRLVAAESPVYFQAYSAVFQVLQGIQHQALPLQSGLLGSDEGAGACVPWAEEAVAYFKDRVESSMDSDPSQCAAMDAMLRRPVSTVQGPPGTGKTFIGLKAVEIFSRLAQKGSLGSICDDYATVQSLREPDFDSDGDRMSDCSMYDRISDESESPSPPLLILCYKNHALDEMIQKCSALRLKCIRIGGRGGPDVQEFTLQAQAKAKEKGKEVKREIWKGHQKREELAEEVKDAFRDLCEDTWPHKVFHRKASDLQLRSLVAGCKGSGHKHVITKSALDAGDRADLPDSAIKDCFKAWIHRANGSRDEDSVQPSTSMSAKQDEDSSENSADEEQEERKVHMVSEAKKVVLQWPERWRDVAGPDSLCGSDVLQCEDVWQLEPNQRAALVRAWTTDVVEMHRASVENLLYEYSRVLRRIEVLEQQHRVDVLRSADVVGATITGACINVQLLRDVGFKVCIIEEAAEILEPLTVPAIPPSIQQLILIGDHLQLRPLLEVEELGTRANLDISMMERLINANGGRPSAQLTKQNRMRSELVELIRDIYPTLETNRQRVAKHLPVPGLLNEGAMFFKDTSCHTSEHSKGGRSLCNPGEAEEIIQLVMFLTAEGIQQNLVTILSLYKGQKWLVSDMLKHRGYDGVKVETVDQYQGDENDVILISMVRSDNSTRFVDSRNRRCVAASRGHRCTIFFGAVPMLERRAQAWKHVIRTLKQRGLVGSKLPLACPRHPDIQLELGECCSQMCREFLSCGHMCGKPCHPAGAHPPCKVIVRDVCTQCWNPLDHPCSQPLSEVKCKHKVKFTQSCGHTGNKMCSEATPKCNIDVPMVCSRCGEPGDYPCWLKQEKPDEYRCQKPCALKMSCGHPCRQKCYMPCEDGIDDCELCEAERADTARRKKEEYEDLLQQLASDDYIDISEGTECDLPEVQKEVQCYYDSTGVVASVTRVRKVTNRKLRRRFLTTSQACCAPREATTMFLVPTANADEAEKASRGGFDTTKRFSKFMNFYSKRPSKEKSKVFLLCEVQLGRHYEYGVRKHIANMSDRKPPEGFDSGYSKQDGLYRLWVVSRALPRYIVHVETKASAGDPAHWTSRHVPGQGWSAVYVEDRDVNQALKMCLVTNGHELGRGRDVVEGGRYNHLDLYAAWRLEHPGLWQRYLAERRQIQGFAQRHRQNPQAIKIRDELEHATRRLPDLLESSINEVRLLHGTRPDTLLPILNNGPNERFSGGLFGEGTYFAEDAGKNDQYVTSDAKYGQVKDLHERLYRDGAKHPQEKVYYLLLCRVILGYFVRTLDGVRDLDNTGDVWAKPQKELSVIPGVTPPVHHHALVAELGGKITRYREFIQFHAERTYPEYIIAYRRR